MTEIPKKVCYTCGRELYRHEFPHVARNVDGCGPNCKECKKAKKPVSDLDKLRRVVPGQDVKTT